jgi:glycosyltransferase involved in cell wall biosynthesis
MQEKATIKTAAPPDSSRRNPHPRPLVTIGIPTYNRANTYLPEALGSALAQDYPNLELIISDNGSTDGTEAFVKSLNDPRIRYFRQEPSLRPNDNFNFCLQKASGTYFLLLHDDDRIDADFVSACMKAAQGQDDLGIIRTGTRTIDSEGKTIGENPNLAEDLGVSDFFRAWFRGRTAFYLPSTLFNTQALKQLGGFQSKRQLFQDVVALVRLAARYDRADVREIKASFRRHDANMGADPVRVMAWAEDCLYLRDVIVGLVPHGDKKAIRQEASAYLCRKAYKQARSIPRPLVRLWTYARVFAMFGYRHPSPYVVARGLNRRFAQGLNSLVRSSRVNSGGA